MKAMWMVQFMCVKKFSLLTLSLLISVGLLSACSTGFQSKVSEETSSREPVVIQAMVSSVSEEEAVLTSKPYWTFVVKQPEEALSVGDLIEGSFVSNGKGMKPDSGELSSFRVLQKAKSLSQELILKGRVLAKVADGVAYRVQTDEGEEVLYYWQLNRKAFEEGERIEVPCLHEYETEPRSLIGALAQ